MRNSAFVRIVSCKPYKRLRGQRSEAQARVAIAHMPLGRVVKLDEGIAILGAELSLEHSLPIADSLILATARRF